MFFFVACVSDKYIKNKYYHYIDMKTKWTYEECKKAASMCNSRAMFWDKYSRAARISKQNGWDNDFFEKNTSMPQNYWTEDMCIKDSKRYSLFTEYRDSSPTSFYKAKKNGWLQKMTWLVDDIKKFNTTSTNHLIYAYIIEICDNKYAYIGRTFQLKQRDYEHRRIKRGKRDVLNQFCYDNGIDIPIPIVIESGLTLTQSQEKEDLYIKEYKSKGYVILNVGKTGIGIGSVGNAGIKWDYDTCYKEAKKYNTKIEFYHNSNGAWCRARSEGWLKDYTWLYSPQKPKKYWTKETCMDAAKTCATLNELRKKYEEVYKLAIKYGWLAEYTWIKRQRTRHTDEECINIIKTCKTKQELRNKHYAIYSHVHCTKRYWLFDHIGTGVE